MKKTGRRLAGLLMSLCLLVGLLPATVWAGESGETTYGVTLNYEESLCTVTAYELFMGEDGFNDPSKNKLLVTGDGGTVQVPEGTWLLLEISNIQSGYRIGSVILNGADRTEGFVNGGYGSLSFKTLAQDYTLTARMEEIPDPLPSVTAVTLYTDAAGNEPAQDNINYTSENKNDKLYGIASFSDSQKHPNYYATGQWQYSTDGTTWHNTETWGSNRFDFWPGWGNHKELDFLNASYDLRLMVEPQDLYTTGAPVYSNIIHINGGASSQEHSWSDWGIREQPTCTEEGVEQRVCQDEGCGAVETRPVPALGHKLSYTAINNGTTIQQVCDNGCGHSATGTLAATNYSYTGIPQGVSFVSFGEWMGPYPKTWEANNDYVNAGEKTVYAEIGGVTISCSYTIFRAEDYTVTLGNLEQYSNNVTPVTWTTAPPDETAQATVEYQVTTSGTPEWTTQLPTAAGSYPVRVKLTDSQNLELKTGDEAYTTGTLTILNRPSGGSSGGSSSSGNKTETERNPDGSTTTTVTRPDGTVTETTKNPDGSLEVVETKKNGTVTTTTTDPSGNKTEVVDYPDGSSKTTISNQDGSSSTTTVDEDGRGETQVKLPAAVVEDADGQAVALPMPQVRATADREDAPAVIVDLPSGSSAKVEIPVRQAGLSTVAVLVKDDGTEKVIKTSLTTENGVMVTLSDGDTVKIVENAKSFADVPQSYWGSEYIDFVTSREIFSGTQEDRFSPELPMDRAMIVTVLAALDGADTSSTGGAWYEAGQRWAMLNGISDGTNMDQPLTREQLAVMLWNYAGKPESSYSLTGYPDWTSASDWAAQAMAWAVEEGLISNLNGALAPQGTATRAQVATILMRFVENMA